MTHHTRLEMTKIIIIFLFAEIGKSCARIEMKPAPPPTSSPAADAGAAPDAGGEPASVYQEQMNLESMLDVTIEVSGESGGEDDIPEEVLLDSSTEQCQEPAAPNNMMTANTDSITTYSESAAITTPANIATNSELVATNSESRGTPPAVAIHSESSTALLPRSNEVAATVAAHSESGPAPVATDSEANSGAGSKPPEHMDTAVRKKPIIPGEYYAIQNARKMMRTVPDLNGGYPTANTQPGSLFPDNDSRIDICNVTFDIKAKQVTSYSYDPEKMSCHCCGEFLARQGDKAGRQTFVLADQNFPASLPSDNTGPKCIKILRIEGGRLGELADKMMSITAGWHIPPGSLILIGSLSHLAETGFAAYASDLCNAVAKLSVHFRGSISVAPAPFSLAEDTEDSHLIRSIYDLYGWVSSCLKHVEGLSLTALSTAMEGLIYNGGGAVQPDTVRKYRLPTTLYADVHQIWTSSGLASLPSRVRGFDMGIECEIMGRLISELNTCLGLDLQTNPYYDRTVVKEDLDPVDTTTYILIGGSHALRTANGLARLGKRAVAATYGGWRPTAEQTAAIINKIGRAKNHCPDTSKVVCVLQLWDSCNYFVQDEEGGLSAAKKEEDDRYHVKGANVFAHTDTQLLTFKKTLPVIEAVKDMRKIFLSPLPRYWVARCCGDKRHVSNLGDPDYRQKLEASVYEAKNNLRAFSFREGIKNLRVIGSWHQVKKTEGIWGADPVHMKDAGYDALAAHIVETASDMEAKRKTDTPLQNPAKKSKPREADPAPTDRHRYQRSSTSSSDNSGRLRSTGDSGRGGDRRQSGSGRLYTSSPGSGSGTRGGSGYYAGSDYGRRRRN